MTSVAARLTSFEIGMHSDTGRYLVPLGRLLFAAIFLLAVPGHFTGREFAQASEHGVPVANVLVPLSGIVAAAGGLSVLLGYRARIGGLLLALFLIPVTIMMHDFWAATSPMQMELQRVMFMKNVAMLGGTFLIMYFGAGPVSFDARSRFSA